MAKPIYVYEKAEGALLDALILSNNQYNYFHIPEADVPFWTPILKLEHRNEEYMQSANTPLKAISESNAEYAWLDTK